ncbi:membrane-bound lytic murein transglycosylase B [Cryobacterium sp. MP_3.1]|uniref:lytic transglycosylase domain-containing protein n=1 Tax=Cryobacterium sp. MP_3.1 TaxID=3071711 RepID=UPI002E03B377|nr:membrane-bound lytic murein transglycosylase B [Cryobacterium sp. MP_3.1]
MTGSPGSRQGVHDVDFQALLVPTGDAAPALETIESAGRRRWLLSSTAALGLLGFAALGAALLVSSLTATGTRAAPAPVMPKATPTSFPAGDGAAVAASVPAPVAVLAEASWLAATAHSTGIPERALAAYAGAAIELDANRPGCHLGWNTLAAIGLVESEHGSIFGGEIGADGAVSPAVIGIPLDGSTTAAIRDTDAGELDGDSVWDRAVGPMQFIPETWQQFAQDGNRDGHMNVQNIDDAVLTAATYLCSADNDLSEPPAWIAAISAYNPSLEYNARVASAADAYAAASIGRAERGIWTP